jgi:hypothetical protein
MTAPAAAGRDERSSALLHVPHVLGSDHELLTLPLLLRLISMAVHSEPLSQRLASIREQLKLLADYL